MKTHLKPHIWDGTSAAGFDSGTGTELDPYIIMTPEQLAYFRDQVNGGRNFSGEYVKVGADLLMNDTTGWENWDTTAPANSWTPIGNSTNRFNGTFDGDNHTISGIYINTTLYSQGLFGYAENGAIANVGVIDSYISGSYHVGSVVGNSGSSLTNCYFDGVVKGTGTEIGGVVGCHWGGVTNCYNYGEVIGSSTSECIGGVAGMGYSGLSGCFNGGSVTGYRGVGGVVGCHDGGTMDNCYNIGTVTNLGTGEYLYCGGVAGVNYATINTSYNAGRVISTDTRTGAITGLNQTTVNCYYLDWTYEVAAPGGATTGCTALTDAQMQSATNFTGFDFTDVWTMDGDPDYLYPELKAVPHRGIVVQPITVTVTTLGGAARFDKTAIRFGASIAFADLADVSVGDTIDYGFNINGLRNDALTYANWTKLSAASTTANFTGFTWTADMEAATTPSELAAVIRAAGIKVYAYDANSITFAVILNNLPMTAQDSLWVFEPYVTIKGTDTSNGAIKYNSVNRILEDIASGTYTA